jgi:hypothetical protein
VQLATLLPVEQSVGTTKLTKQDRVLCCWLLLLLASCLATFTLFLLALSDSLPCHVATPNCLDPQSSNPLLLMMQLQHRIHADITVVDSLQVLENSPHMVPVAQGSMESLVDTTS